ncbi:hypothetical protein KUTeg_024967 [Tegillarca granosa]|uniref:C2H2-type domain-containing protein n=1 Tax=Tegillarca granosa TaxID=220873 RepID=A0ABQ9E3X7_TEGGR|nr:hypothetical protein KUTeg_024967 [Tegillarca granosa]
MYLHVAHLQCGTRKPETMNLFQIKMEEEEPELKYTCSQNKSTLHIFEKAKVKIKKEVGISDPIREEHKSDYQYINNKMMLDKLKESEEKRDDIKTRIKLEREEVNYKEKEVMNSAKVCIKREFDGQQTQDDGISESKIPFLDKSKVFSEQSENDNVNIATGKTKISNIKIIEKSKLGANGNNTSYRSIINMANIKAGNISKSNTNSGSNTVKYTSLLANRPLGVNVIQSKTSREDKSSSDSGSLSGISGRENIVIEVGDSPKNPVSFLVVNGSNSGSSSSAPAVNKVVIDTVKLANNSGLVKSTDGSDQKIKYRSILDKVNNKSNSSNSSQNMDQSVSGFSSSGNTTASKIVIDADKSHYNSLLAQNADGSTKKVKYQSILNPSKGKPSVASNTNFSEESDMQNENVYSTFVDSKPDEADLEFYNPTNFNVLVNRVGGEIRIKMVDSMPLDKSKSSKCNKNNKDDNEDSEIDEFSEDNQVGDAEEGSETHACNFCAKLFPTTEKLEEHSMQHSVKDFYQCFICKERFLFDDDLKEHFSVHTLEKPYKCDVCEKKFTNLIVDHNSKLVECNIISQRLRIEIMVSYFCGMTLSNLVENRFEILTENFLLQSYLAALLLVADAGFKTFRSRILWNIIMTFYIDLREKIVEGISNNTCGTINIKKFPIHLIKKKPMLCDLEFNWSIRSIQDENTCIPIFEKNTSEPMQTEHFKYYANDLNVDIKVEQREITMF